MFKDDIPDYKAYVSNEYRMSKVPADRDFWVGIEAFASRSESLQTMVNKLNRLVLIPPTTNWGYPFLVVDLSEVMKKIKNKAANENFQLLMDTISIVVEDLGLGNNLSEINDFLLQYSIGYQLEYENFSRKYQWSVRDNAECLSDRIEETITNAEKNNLQQAIEHLKQAKEQLENTSTERARKNAVRDCASAMESIIKNLGEDVDIKQASKKLRDSKQWGQEDIVKDGDAIFNKLHHLYPDFRHGTIENSSITLNEAKYWIDRITVYIDYMLKQKESLGL